MANSKPPATGEELTPEQQKFLEAKQQQESRIRSDQGDFLKSGRQVKEEKKAAKKAARPEPEPVSRR
ncbi:MAG: hypothetical protein ACK2U9_12020 [Anaerolineae bacterium]